MLSPFSSILFSLLLSAIAAFEPRSPEVIALMAVRDGLKDPRGVLSSWDEYSVDPCSFAMVTCSSDNLVVGLGIPSQSLSGTLASAIGNLTNLRQVQLQDNNISGRIPPEMGGLSELQTLDLANNRFSGDIPESMGLLRRMNYLRINNNTLSGAIPLSLATSPLLALVDLSFNNLSGPLPGFGATTSVSVVGNTLICGRQNAESSRGCGSPISILTPTSSPPSHGGIILRRIAAAVGISLGSIVIIFTFIFGLVLWRRKQLQTQSSLRINDKEEAAPEGLGNLRRFTLRELQAATEGFTAKNILGSGGFGNVYKGKLGDGTLVAVKRLKDMGGTTTGESQFRTEVEMISLAVHRNLLRLIGYCATPTERLLVYPFMVNGSLASRLRGKPALEWEMRKKIAVGAGRGLVYLHEQCDPKIIHRDVKAANVLVDEFYEAVVGDFGLAKLMDHSDSHVTTAVRGTVGHIAPEYLSTGHSSEKTDVFGFGILLLELISGMRAVHLGNTLSQKGAILQWVRKMKDEKKAEIVVDVELGGKYDRVEVKEMLQVAMLCTETLPGLRPRMSEVVKMLEGGDRMAAGGGGTTTEWKPAAEEGWLERSSSCVLGRMVSQEDDDEDDHSLDAFAMELSGPR